jgi:hypothetical protein
MRLLALLLLMIGGPAGEYGAEPCRATPPPVPAFTPPLPYSPAPFGDTSFLVGTQDLWVSLPGQPWHGLRHKLFWWRPGFDGAREQRPALALTLRPVNSAVTSSVDRTATNAQFGGEWSMLILVDFPAPGCWEVRGSYGGHSVTFVTSVEP